MVKDAFKMLLESPLLLSRNFKLSEFLYSDTAKEKNIDNVPHNYKRFSVVLENLVELCNYLEVIRAATGNKPVYITSGFRSVQLNQMVKGIYGSHHILGAAADITAKDFDNLINAVEFCYAGSPYVDYEINLEKRYIHVELKCPKRDERKSC